MSKLIGTDPNQVPSNADLGTLAYQDADNVNLGNLIIDSTQPQLKITGDYQTRISLGTIYTDKPHWSITNEANANRLRIGVADDANDTNFTYAMVVTDQSEVGIGVSSPDAKFHVESVIGEHGGTDTTPDFPVIIAQNDLNNTINQLGGSGVGILFKNASNSIAKTGAAIASIKQTGDDDNSSAELAFYTSDNDDILDEAVRIDSAGYVGINVTDPKRTLHVAGTAIFNNDADEYYGVMISNGENTDPSVLIGDWHNASGRLWWDSSARSLNIDTQYSTSAADFNITGNDGAETFLKINDIGEVELPNHGISTRYVSSPATYNPGANIYWVRIFYREYQTPNAFGYNGIELNVSASGRTDGRMGWGRLLIAHKQQQANDQYQIAVLESTGIQFAAKYDPTGGSAGEGLLEIWCKAEANYQSISVNGLVRGATNGSQQSSNGNIVCETTNSGTQPSGSKLLRTQRDVGSLMYRGATANPSLDYNGNGHSQITMDGGSGVGSSSNTQANNDQAFYAAYETVGMLPGVVHANGNWYAMIGSSSYNGQKYAKYALQLNGQDRFRVSCTFCNFSDSTTRNIRIEYSLDGGDTWTNGATGTMGSSSGTELTMTYTADSSGYWNEAGIQQVLFKFYVDGTGSSTGIGIRAIKFQAYGGMGSSINLDSTYKEQAGFQSYYGTPWIRNNLTDHGDTSLWTSVHREGDTFIHTHQFSGTGATSGFNYYISAYSSTNTYWFANIEEFSWIHTNGGNYYTHLRGVANFQSAYAATYTSLDNVRLGESWYGALSIAAQYNGNGNQLVISKANGNSGNLSGGFGRLVIRSHVPLRIRANTSWI